MKTTTRFRPWPTLLATALLATAVHAAPPAAGVDAKPPTAEQMVTTALLEPLAAREKQRSKYSRMALPPSERRVRVLDGTVNGTDASGATFVAFAVDARSEWDGSVSWQKATMTGCVYPTSGAVFVKRGDGYRSAAAYVGKPGTPVPDGVCVAVPAPKA